MKSILVITFKGKNYGSIYIFTKKSIVIIHMILICDIFQGIYFFLTLFIFLFILFIYLFLEIHSIRKCYCTIKTVIV
jgi:hypothetical protein